MEELAGLSEVAAEAQLHLSHPDIYARLKRLHRILINGQNPAETGSSVELSPELSGRQVPVLNVQAQSPQEYPLPPPLPTRQYTYAFQEVRFARKSQRYCLEPAYRLFTESRSNPREFYRMFRLFPCVRDPGKTQPRFRQLLRADVQTLWRYRTYLFTISVAQVRISRMSTRRGMRYTR